MIDRWIKVLRIGYAAYLINSFRTQEYRKIERVLAFLEEELRNASVDFLGGIPPITWRLLLAIEPERLQREDGSSRLASLHSKWDEYLTYILTPRGDNMPSPVSAAQIMAYHILYGIAKPVQLLRLARSLHLTRRLAPEAEIAHAIQTVRSSQSSTNQKIISIECLHNMLFGEYSHSATLWSQVENVLYHHLFSWPLLIHNSGSKGNPISLPVAIDVIFDYAGASNKPIKQKEKEGSTPIDISHWEQSLQTSIYAAKVLWRGKHGNYWGMREAVMDASVAFDLDCIQSIMRGFPIKIKLTQDSMEAYFSQVILRRLLGRTAYISSIVTGSIGEQRKDEEGQLMDFNFNWPDDVQKKLEYVFDAWFFERIVLPDIDENDAERKKVETFITNSKQFQSAEVNYAKHLQHVADCVQSGGWRQNKYVRCPDLAWAIHSPSQPLLAPNTEEVQQCLELLQNNESPVIELEGIRATTLASALRYINTTLRESISIRTPPMISWAFVRAVPEEQDERFWSVIWQLVGAPIEDFELFHYSPTPQHAAQYLAHAMNMDSPSMSFPSYRAPDILVILGADCLSENLFGTTNQLFRIHAFDQILKQLSPSGRLSSIRDSQNQDSLMQRFLGKTRIIVLRKTAIDISTHAFLLPKEETERAILDRLSTFRFGFTQQIASLLLAELEFYGIEVRKVLKDLIDRGCLNYTVNGEYYIPGHIGWDLVESIPAEVRVKRHYSAAMALAPYLSLSVELPSISFDRAFLVENIHEAEYHLNEAYSACKDKETDPSDINKIRDALNNLRRFVAWFKVR